jgi:hypothetical protein
VNTHELPKEVMHQLRDDLRGRLLGEHYQHKMAARLYRKIGRPQSADYEDRQAADKLRMVQALDDPMIDLTHLQEGPSST